MYLAVVCVSLGLMKIDNRNDALDVARRLLTAGATVDDLADALLEAHLEGLDQGRQVADMEDATQQLTKRREFILGEMKKDTAGLRPEGL